MPAQHRLQRALTGLGLAALCLSSLASGGCAQILAHARGEDVPPPAVTLSADEAQVLAATNALRVGNSLPALVSDGRLVLVARRRSSDMASHNYFSHQTVEGEDVFTVMREAHLQFQAAGENLARNTYPEGDCVLHAMADWTASTEHRVNLLHPAFTRVGVGEALAKDGKRYLTQIFMDG